MMNPFKFFAPSHLLQVSPGSHFALVWVFFLLFGLLFLASFFLKKIFDSKKIHQWALEPRLREFALLGLLWGFFRWQNIPYLSMRLWLLLIALAYFFHFVWVIWGPQEEQEDKNALRKARASVTDPYLPKPKKKSKRR